MYSLKKIVAPANLPVTLEEMKLYLREDYDAQDDVITALIAAAVDWVEEITGRALMPQTLDFGIDLFPMYTTGTKWPFLTSGIIRVPRAPLQSVSQITYVDTDGTRKVIAPADYVVDTQAEPGRLYPAFGKFWPYTSYWPYVYPLPDAIIIRFVAGYAAEESPEDADAERAAVPAAIKTAIKLIVGHWYENRVAVETGLRAQAIDVPLTAKELLGPYRLFGNYP